MLGLQNWSTPEIASFQPEQQAATPIIFNDEPMADPAGFLGNQNLDQQQFDSTADDAPFDQMCALNGILVSTNSFQLLTRN